MTERTRSWTSVLLAGIAVIGYAQCADSRTDQKESQERAAAMDPKASSSVSGTHHEHRVVFGTFAESEEQLAHILILAESIRSFAGVYADAPIWVYLPEGSMTVDHETRLRLTELKAEVCRSSAPEAALQFYFSRKIFAADAAERRAQSFAEILVWMDDDTVILKEPHEISLDQGIVLGYRPVMHQNIGSLYSEPADSFWSRVYDVLEVPESTIFPMMTPADKVAIRPYFNAGLLVIRPETGILRKWAESFPKLYEDRILVEMCKKDVFKRIFLHQAALVGAILTTVRQEHMTELPSTFNYPLFFHDRYESKKAFESVEGITSLRYDVYFRDPEPDWKERLTGPPDLVEWLQERLGR